MPVCVPAPLNPRLSSHSLDFYFLLAVSSSPLLSTRISASCLPASPPASLTFHQDFEKISDYFKANYKVELSEKDMCVKGWNWGTAKFSGNEHTAVEMSTTISLHMIIGSSVD